jgi:hypothetical protein
LTLGSSAMSKPQAIAIGICPRNNLHAC